MLIIQIYKYKTAYTLFLKLKDYAMKRFSLTLLLATTLLCTSPNIIANDTQSKTTQIEQKMSQAVEDMNKAMVQGPSSINLADQANLDLHGDYIFVPKNEAAKYMKAMGNSESPNLLGMILPKDENSDWAILIEHNLDGHVSEEDADKWNADELLKSLKDGTEAANSDRQNAGHHAIHVMGWIEKPTYDKANHKMVWSIEGKADMSEERRFVNYKTYAFGRLGFLELTLMTSKDTVDANKLHAANILKATQFNKGYRYEDYVEGMDKAAGYGLAALVAGVAAKKLGLLAMAGVFLLKIWKLLAIGAFLALGFVRRLFGRKKNGEQG
jgi:uncharacterized membrane-anchored protein